MAPQNLENMSKMAQTSADSALNMWTGWAKGWQAVGAEMTDYSKRSFEDGAKTMEKLMTARSVEQAMEIQSSYAKRSYEDYVQQMTRITSMYTELAKDNSKPFEAMAKPFEAMAKPFEAMAKPFEAMTKPFEAMTKPFEAMTKQFEAMSVFKR